MLQLRVILLSSIYMLALCCYGDDVNNYEIKLLLKDVLQQLKRQNKKTEKALDYLEIQNERLGDVIIQLDFQRRKAENVLELLHKQDIKVVTMLENLTTFKPKVIVKSQPEVVGPPSYHPGSMIPGVSRNLDFIPNGDNVKSYTPIGGNRGLYNISQFLLIILALEFSY